MRIVKVSLELRNLLGGLLNVITTNGVNEFMNSSLELLTYSKEMILLSEILSTCRSAEIRSTDV